MPRKGEIQDKVALPGKKKTGRPPTVIDWVLVEDLARIQCTVDEIAAIIKVPKSTLHGKPEFSDVYKRGSDNGKASLRRAQWKLALAGNATMCIWLGKNLLGQRDQPATTGDTDWSTIAHMFRETLEANS